MILTNKCKADFENWFANNLIAISDFYLLPRSMKYGVYVDFFETKGIYINISNDFYKNGVNHLWQVFVYDNTQPDFLSNLSTGAYGDNGDYDKDTSRIKSIEAANEIYNKLNVK